MLDSEHLLRLARSQSRLVQSAYSLAESTPIFRASSVSDTVSAADQGQLYHCRQVAVVTSGIRPMAPHHCRLAAYASNSFSFKMQILFFCLFGPRIPDLQYVECAEHGATRLNARYTYSPLSWLLPLGQPDVVPQAWAGRRQVFVPGCVHQAVVFLPGIFLAFHLATPYRSHRSSWSTTVVRHRGWLCRRSCVFGLPPLCHLLQSNRDHRANARFLPQLYHLGGGC